MKKSKKKNDYFGYKVALFLLGCVWLYILFPNFFKKEYDPTFDEIKMINEYYNLMEESIPVYADCGGDNCLVKASTLPDMEHLFASAYSLKVSNIDNDRCDDRYTIDTKNITYFFQCILNKQMFESFDRSNMFKLEESTDYSIKYSFETKYTNSDNQVVYTKYPIELVKIDDVWQIKTGVFLFDSGVYQYRLSVGVE